MIIGIRIFIVLSIFLAILWTPFFTAIGVRMIVKRSNRKLVAALTAIPFTVFLISRPDYLHLPDFDSFEMPIQILFWIIILSLTLLLYFGIPYLMARGGINVADRIIKRNSNLSYEPPLLGQKNDSAEQKPDQR